MLSRVVGAQIMRKSLQKCLLDNMYSTVNMYDLFHMFQNELNNAEPSVGWSVSVTSDSSTTLNITDFLYCFIVRPGIPLVTVTRVSPSIVHLTQVSVCMCACVHSCDVQQKLLFVSETMNKSSTAVSTSIDVVDPQCTAGWHIPVWYKTSSDPFVNDSFVWLIPEHRPLVLHINMTSDWILINSQSYGYYRTNYDPQTWQSLARLLMEDRNVGCECVCGATCGRSLTARGYKHTHTTDRRRVCARTERCTQLHCGTSNA
jgi:hypothetical protein